MKVCTLCKEEKALVEFSWRVKKENLRQTRCKPCRNLKMKEHREDNIESYKEKDRQYGLNNKEVIAERKARYYKDNREQINTKARDGWSSHYSRNRLNYIYKGRARVSKLRQATPAWSEVEQIQDLYKEAHKLHLITGELYHVDHQVPLNNKLVCGLHCISNLQILEASVNIKKNNRFIV